MNYSNEWAEKYRPKTLKDIVGNSTAIGHLKTWAQKWIEGIPEKRAVLLHGPAGVGKTSTAYALAQDMNWEVIELNASDQRTADVIERIAGSASQMKSLDGSNLKRLIILDEADNLHGTSDRGGAKAITNIVKSTNQPIILIANDAYGISTSIKAYVSEIKYNSLQKRSIISALKNIADLEGLICTNDIFDKIAENADGDLRSAINDLQAVALGKEEIKIEDIVIGQRDNKDSIFKVMDKIFKGTDSKAALEATYLLDESPEDLIHWIDENIITQYADKDSEIVNDAIRNSYHYISQADIFLGRVKRRQNYLMWKYAGILMTCGTVVSKSKINKGFIKYNPPSLWRRMGQLKAKRNMRNNIAAKVSNHSNESMRYANSKLMEIYSILLHNPQYAPEIIATLDLELEELIFIIGATKVTKKIQKMYDEAQILKKPSKIEFIHLKPSIKTDKNQKSINEILEEKLIIEKDIELKVEANNKKRKPQKTLFEF